MASERTDPKVGTRLDEIKHDIDLDIDDTGSWMTDSVGSALDDTDAWANSVIGSPVPSSAKPIETPPVSPSTPGPTPTEAKKTEAKNVSSTSTAPQSTGTKGGAGSSDTSRKSESKSRPSNGKPANGKPSNGKQKPPKRPLWRGRILPKTVLGISFTMLVSGLAMAVSGTLLFMNYRFRQDQSNALVQNFPAQVRAAQRAVKNEGINARAQVQQELDPIRKLAATAETLNTVLGKTGPSVWDVRTFDIDGQPTAGSAFIVASDDQKTFLLTSLSVVEAATQKPGPKVMLRHDGQELEAQLWTWQESSDLALLILQKGGLSPLSWAAPDATRLGDQVFSVSGIGAEGAIVEGRVSMVSSTGLLHTAQIGTSFRGGPILDAQGRVVAVGSRSYAPLGFSSEGVFFAPPVQASCDAVLKCAASGRITEAGKQR